MSALLHKARLYWWRLRNGALRFGVRAQRSKLRSKPYKPPAWLAKWEPKDSSWRTRQTSLLSTEGATLSECSETWPRSGLMRNGIAYRLPPLTHPTSVIASGSSPDAMWPTMHGMAYEGQKRRHGPSGNELGRAVNQEERRMMPTLRATDGTHGGRVTPRKSREGGNLIEHISNEIWPTLTARDYKSGRSPPAGLVERMETTRGVPLSEAVLYPTLTATRRSGLQSHGENAILGSLNPTWCEWFMGLPLGWTESMASATATRRSSRKQSCAP